MYLTIATHFFITWLDPLASDGSLFLPEDSSVLIDLLMAALLWPVVAPIAHVHFFE
jgi:hypothetical protein